MVVCCLIRFFGNLYAISVKLSLLLHLWYYWSAISGNIHYDDIYVETYHLIKKILMKNFCKMDERGHNLVSFHFAFPQINLYGWKSFKVYYTRWKGPSPYYGPFLPYILIPIKINESKVVNFFKRTIFNTLQF
jgi:hypothetical protein